MGRKLSTRTRELAAAWIGMTIARKKITTDVAARLVAEADCQGWDSLGFDDKEYYRTCANNLLHRISDPPHGLPMVKNHLWTLV